MIIPKVSLYLLTIVILLALSSGVLAIVVNLLPAPYQKPNMEQAIAIAPLVVEDIYKVHIELPNAGGFTHINTLEKYTTDAIKQLQGIPSISIVDIKYDYASERYFRADVYFRKQND